MLKLCKIHACPNGTLGLHLSRAPWDPYPWVSGVQDGSNAYQAGVRSGDTVLELNGCDVLGQKIAELAAKIQNHWQQGGSFVSVLIWRNMTDSDGISQQSLQKFAKCLQQIAQLLECPVCLEVVKPPGWQCCNGHVLCNSCRGRTVKCPICRVALGPRGRCLLSDNVFTLLAENFPCDAVRKATQPPDSSRDLTECHDSLPPSPPVNTNMTSTSASVFPTSSLNLDKVHRQDDQMSIINHNNTKQLSKPDEDTNQQECSAYSRSPKGDKNIVVLKLNPKSKRKTDSVEHASCHQRQRHHHHRHHHHHHHHHSHHSHQSTPDLSGLPLPGQQQTSFHCPTGKSSCLFTTTHNNSRSSPGVKTLYCSWTEDVSRKPKGEENIETLARFITEWDVLSHLTQVHQISVAQHYTTFDQAVRLQLLNSKSMNCITIQSEHALHPDKENFKNNVNVSVDGGVSMPTMTPLAPCNDAGYRNSRPTSISCMYSGTKLFFVACIPLLEAASVPVDTHIDWNEVNLRNGISDMGGHSRGYVPRIKSELDGCLGIADAEEYNPISATRIATKSKSIRGSSSPLVHFPKSECSCTSPASRHANATDTLQSRANGERCSPTSCCRTCVYRLKVEPDLSTWDTTSSPSSSSASSSPSFRFSTLSCPSVCSSTSYQSSLASLSMSSCSSYYHCSNANMNTNPHPPATQHAIFIWYCGNECDAKNYQTVIECKRTGLKWTGCIHSLTKNWSSIQRRHRRQKQDADEQFLVLDSVPDGGVEKLFDITIKIK